MNIKYPFIDLFAGCGGLSLGLEMSGFTPVYVNELNNDALKTYKINREDLKHLYEKEFFSNNIFELTKSLKNLNKLEKNLKYKFGINKKDLSLIVGGPPCQGYSGIGHRRNYKVNKDKIPSNFLYKEMVKVIEFFQPKAFIFENVRGLISARWSPEGKFGEIFKDVKNQFYKLKNYYQDFALIECKNYGVPQNRPRVFIIGVRNDLNFIPNKNLVASGLLPEADKSYPQPYELLSDLIDENYKKNLITKYYLKNPETTFQKRLRTLKNNKSFLKKGDVLLDQEYSNHSHKIIEKFTYMIKNKGKIPEKYKTKKFAQRVLTEKWGPKGPNITATSLPDDYVHYYQPRCLTVREWARLQMFPDWYKFHGKRTTGGIRRAGNPQQGIWDREVPKYTQIGNAVPVELARRIGKNLIDKIKF